jgi:UPF0716 family protein affecting phage T7 exclusion
MHSLSAGSLRWPEDIARYVEKLNRQATSGTEGKKEAVLEGVCEEVCAVLYSIPGFTMSPLMAMRTFS